jgi:hypothetical protein
MVLVDSMDLGLVHQIPMGQITAPLLTLATGTVISVDKSLQDLTMYQLEVALMGDQVHTGQVVLLDPRMVIYLQVPVSMIGNFLEVLIWVIQDLGEMVSVVHVMVLPIVMTIKAVMLLASDDRRLVHLTATHPLGQEEAMGLEAR